MIDENFHADASTAELTPYHLFMFVLGIYALLALCAQTFLKLDVSTQEVLDCVDNVLCVVFFADFLIQLYAAPQKSKFLIWGWIDLLSCIPTVDVLRVGRVARVLRILRAFRSIRSAHFLAKHLTQSRSDGAFYGAALLSLLLILFASIAVLQFETAPESNIRTPQDALWWAFTTITTVGYGDRFPVTLEGRMIAGMLMLAGVGMFATFTGLMASWLITPSKRDAEQDSALAEMRNELRELRGLIIQGARHRSDKPIAGDPEIDRLITAWPELPATARSEIVARLENVRRKAA